MNDALYLHLRHVETPIERLIREQQARHIRVKLMARYDFIPHPYDPDYWRVIQAVNNHYVAALASNALIDNAKHASNPIFSPRKERTWT